LRQNGAYSVPTVDVWAYVDVAFFTQNGSYNIMKFCTRHVEHCVCVCVRARVRACVRERERTYK